MIWIGIRIIFYVFSNWSKTSRLEYLSLTTYIGPHTFRLRNSWHVQNQGNWQNPGISLKISKMTEFQSSPPFPINAAPLKWGLPAVLSVQSQLSTIYYSASFHSSSLPHFTRVLSESQPSQTPPPPIPILKLPNPRPLPPGYSPPHPPTRQWLTLVTFRKGHRTHRHPVYHTLFGWHHLKSTTNFQKLCWDSVLLGPGSHSKAADFGAFGRTQGFHGGRGVLYLPLKDRETNFEVENSLEELS